MKNLLILFIGLILLLARTEQVQAQEFALVQYVAPSGNDSGYCTLVEQPCQSINYALSKDLSNVEIRVAAGIYREPIVLNRPPSVFSQPITLTGGFTLTNWITPSWTTNLTILDGQNSYRPLTIQASTVRVDGFFVKNGNATFSDRIGGGIFVGGLNQVHETTLVNLRIENNVASTADEGEGGGLAAVMGDSLSPHVKLTLENVTVISNTASTGHLSAVGGGMSLQATGGSQLKVEMSNVRIEQNRAGNDFSSSGGGLALHLNGGTATLKQSYILDNGAAQGLTTLGGASRGGGIYLRNGNLALENVLLAGNAGERGDALSIHNAGQMSATVAMNYVTLANNYHDPFDASAAIHGEGDGVNFVLNNTLLSGNPTAFRAPFNSQPISLTLVNSLIDNDVFTLFSGKIVTAGISLRGSAGFINATSGDYRLSAKSDAIDKGNNLPPLVDLAGVARPRGSASEIGAYEFTPMVKGDQTITFTALSNRQLGDPSFVVTATASSGLLVALSSDTPTICTLQGNRVTLRDVGTCTIRATQAGNDAFNLASPVTRSFNVISGSPNHALFLPLVSR